MRGLVPLFVINTSMMMMKDTAIYVESKIPVEKHKYLGWFWYYPTKKFYRWNDIPYHIKEQDGNS